MSDHPDRGRAVDRTVGDLLRDVRVRAAALGVLGLLALVFVVQNSDSTTVDVFFWQATLPLVWVLAAMVGVGVLLDRLLVWRSRRRRDRDGDRRG